MPENNTNQEQEPNKEENETKENESREEEIQESSEHYEHMVDDALLGVMDDSDESG